MNEANFKLQEDGRVWWCLVTHKTNEEQTTWINAITDYFSYNFEFFGYPKLLVPKSKDDRTTGLLYKTKPYVLQAVLKQTGLVVQNVTQNIYFLTGGIDIDKKLRIKVPIDPTKDYSKMYAEFEEKYNTYPIQMAAYDAFRHALSDKLIDEETYQEAREYFGNLWNYVGD